MPSVALLRVTNTMRPCPMVFASVSSVRSASAARVATPRKSGQQRRPPLTKGVNTGSSYDPASRRSEGGRHAVDWMATFLWTGWQHSSGLGGRNPWNTQSSGSTSRGAPPQEINIGVRGGRHRCQTLATVPASWEVGIPEWVVSRSGRLRAEGRIGNRLHLALAVRADVG